MTPVVGRCGTAVAWMTTRLRVRREQQERAPAVPPAAEHRRGVVEWVVVRVVVVQVQERQQMASAEVVQPLEERQGRPALEEVRTMSVSGKKR